MLHKQVKHSHSIAKAVTWRVIATTTTVIAVYILTNEWKISLGVGLIEGTAKLAFYYLHERAWLRVSWGVRPPNS